MEVKDEVNTLYAKLSNQNNLNKAAKVYIAQNNFEMALNKFLNRTIALTHVSADGSINLRDEEFIKKIIENQGFSLGTGRMNVTAASFEKIKANVSNKIKSLQDQINNSSKIRDDVYATAYLRYQDYKEYATTENKFAYYWIHDDGTYSLTGKITTAGEIAEGYVNAVVEESESILNSKLESSLEQLWLQYIQNKKDSIPASVKGDVVMNNVNGNVQLAVKANDFSTSRIGQYLHLAENILKIKENVTPQELQLAIPKLLKSTSDVSTKVLEILNNKERNYEKNIKKLITKLLENKTFDSPEWHSQVELIQSLVSK